MIHNQAMGVINLSNGQLNRSFKAVKRVFEKKSGLATQRPFVMIENQFAPRDAPPISIRVYGRTFSYISVGVLFQADD